MKFHKESLFTYCLGFMMGAGAMALLPDGPNEASDSSSGETISYVVTEDKGEHGFAALASVPLTAAVDVEAETSLSGQADVEDAISIDTADVHLKRLAQDPEYLKVIVDQYLQTPAEDERGYQLSLLKYKRWDGVGTVSLGLLESGSDESQALALELISIEDLADARMIDALYTVKESGNAKNAIKSLGLLAGMNSISTIEKEELLAETIMYLNHKEGVATTRHRGRKVQVLRRR